MRQSITLLAILFSLSVFGQSSVSRIAVTSSNRDTLYIDSAFVSHFNAMWSDIGSRPVFVPVSAEQLERMMAPAPVRKRKKRCAWG